MHKKIKTINRFIKIKISKHISFNKRKYYEIFTKFFLKKGIYAFEYINEWNKFNETELPTIDQFYSKLNFKNMSKEDHRHAQNVWNIFNIENLGEYHDLYVQSDTIQLADTFEQFRTACLKEYD